MTITIYNSLKEQTEKKLQSVAKKANKYGKTLSWSFGEPYVKRIGIYENKYDPSWHATFHTRTGETLAEAIDLTIEGDALIRQDGWTAVAHLEHLDNGNIVTRFNGSEEPIPDAWRKLAPHCDHCNTNHKRKATYIVKDNAGNTRQVGTTCLLDYTGINPATVTAFAQLWDEITLAECNYDNYDPDRERDCRIYDVDAVIAKAVDVINKYGYRKSDAVDSTRHEVFVRLKEHIPYTPEALTKAEQIVAWLKTPEAEQSWDLIKDCIPLAKDGYCTDRHVGRLAYLPVAYDKEMAELAKKREKEAANAKAAAVSKHIGTVGERITRDISSAVLVTSWETYYSYYSSSMTYLYKFTDTEGNVLTWYASNSIDKPENVHRITGTVKKHDVYENVAQTVITRCKVS